MSDIMKPSSKLKSEYSWSPEKVLDEYAAFNGGIVHIRSIIATALREGRLRARAAKRWTSHEKSITRGWVAGKSHPAEQVRSKVLLKRGLWWRSIRWTDDVADWDFRRARAVVTINSDPMQRIMLQGLRFNSADIKCLFASGSLDLQKGATESFSGKERWRRFWYEIVLLAASSDRTLLESNLSAFKSSEALLNHITSKLWKEDVDSTADDTDIAIAISNRLPFDLGKEAIIKELKELRNHFDLVTHGKRRVAD